MKKTVKTYKSCSKCSGSGKIPGYSHVANGICFKCSGSGKIYTGSKTVDVKPRKIYPQKSLEEIEKEALEFDYSSLID